LSYFDPLRLFDKPMRFATRKRHFHLGYPPFRRLNGLGGD
jgi:hypothetical protein